MSDIAVSRWKRYGHDRVYANSTNEVRMGYLDVVTGLVHAEDGVAVEEIEPALRAWCAQNDVSVGSGGAPASAAPIAVHAPAVRAVPPAEPPWEDLAAREPGQLVREREALEWEREKRIGVGLAVVARVLDANTPVRGWRKGAEGEEKVGQALNKLTSHGWKILHSIPEGDRADIDHLAIGPGGIVMINTKHHAGARVSVTKYHINVNGSRTEHLKQVRSQKNRVEKRLSAVLGEPVHVTPCVVIYNGSLLQPEMKIASLPDDVKVATNWNIVNVFKRMDPVLDHDDIERIFEAARRSTTWR